ncbi:MAG: dihydrodipicolinate synthase family protein [Geminicoccaceae bacterium]
MDELPRNDCLIAAVTTPFDADLRPDDSLLLARCRELMGQGCDGVTLFGTTGEGAMIAPSQRMRTLESLLAAGLPPGRTIVSVGALAIDDCAELARHATSLGVAAVLLMPPCVFRGGITDEGAFRFFAVAVDRIGDPRLRLLLYHFPDICGVPLNPPVIRRLLERYGALIAGVKDSGGDWGFTEDLLRRFSELSILTGTEVHLPQATLAGARGTICGLANSIPQLLRRMLEPRTLPERRRFLPAVRAADAILSRGPFIPSVKALLAARSGEATWRRVLPPLAMPGLADARRMADDFAALQATLPEAWREA